MNARLMNLIFGFLLLPMVVAAQDTRSLLGRLLTDAETIDPEITVQMTKIRDRSSVIAAQFFLFDNPTDLLLTDKFSIPTTLGVPVIARTLGFTKSDGGSVIWQGYIGDDEVIRTLSYADGMLSGRFRVSNVVHHISTIGTGVAALTRMNQTDSFTHPVGWPHITLNTADSKPNNDSPARKVLAETVSEFFHQINVGFLFTDDARTEAGGDAAIRNKIVTGIDLANTIAKSAGSGYRYFASHVDVTSYDEPSTFPSDNSLITGFAAGTLITGSGAIRADSYSDIMILVVQDMAGLGKGATLVGPSGGVNTAADAFSFIDQEYIGSETLAHELGHVLGGSHQVFEDGGSRQECGELGEPIAYGHGFMQYNYSTSGTTMTTLGDRYDYFSDPNHIVSSVAHGSETCEDMVRVVEERFSVVGAFLEDESVIYWDPDCPGCIPDIGLPPELQVSTSAPVGLMWDASGTVSAIPIYADPITEDEHVCELCSVDWHIWDSGIYPSGGWAALGVTTQNLLVTMSQTSDMQLRATVSDGVSVVWQNVTVPYCSSPCYDPRIGGEWTLEGIPMAFEFVEAYPNPFKSRIVIRVHLANASSVRVVIRDLIGREVASFVNNAESAGWREVAWDASALGSGIYVAQISDGRANASRMLFLHR